MSTIKLEDPVLDAKDPQTRLLLLAEYWKGKYAALAAKDAPALEAVPVYQYRQFGKADWTDCTGAGMRTIKASSGTNGYELRTIYTAPAKQEAAPLAAPEGGLYCYPECSPTYQALDATDAARWRCLMDWQERGEQPEEMLTMWRKVYAENRLKPTSREFVNAIDAVRATQQSPAVPTDAKESTS